MTRLFGAWFALAVLHTLLSPESGGAARTAAAPMADSIVLAPQAVPGVDTLSSSEIQEAKAFAQRSERLKTYRFNARPRALVGGRAPAALFTPFLRVAIATQAAAAANRPFTESEIPEGFIQRLAWVVGLAAEYYDDFGVDSDGPPYYASVTGMVIRPAGSQTPDADIQPKWQMSLVTAYDLHQFAGLIAYEFNRPATIAAFPMNAIKAGNTIVFTYDSTAVARDSFEWIGVNREVRRMKIGAAQERKWR